MTKKYYKKERKIYNVEETAEKKTKMLQKVLSLKLKLIKEVNLAQEELKAKMVVICKKREKNYQTLNGWKKMCCNVL